jgi:cytidine deaminase
LKKGRPKMTVREIVMKMALRDEDRDELIREARDARKHAYAPYSKYAVGAALRTRGGRIYTGAKVENAAYPLTTCAETAAVIKAVSEGERDFEAMAVVSRNGGSPCGACRQVMAEFGLETLVFIADEGGRLVQSTTVGALLPDAFQPKDLSRE